MIVKFISELALYDVPGLTPDPSPSINLLVPTPVGVNTSGTDGRVQSTFSSKSSVPEGSEEADIVITSPAVYPPPGSTILVTPALPWTSISIVT